MGNLLRWFAGIGTVFKRPVDPLLSTTSPPSTEPPPTIPPPTTPPLTIPPPSIADQLAAGTAEVAAGLGGQLDQSLKADAVPTASSEPPAGQKQVLREPSDVSPGQDDILPGEAPRARDPEDVSSHEPDVTADTHAIPPAQAAISPRRAPAPSPAPARAEPAIAPVQASGTPDSDEIRRRRELIRTLFNDFWAGADDKPLTFAGRLDQAETYVNERLNARGELWRLDANTRKQLGLPSRAS